MNHWDIFMLIDLLIITLWSILSKDRFYQHFLSPKDLIKSILYCTLLASIKYFGPKAWIYRMKMSRSLMLIMLATSIALLAPTPTCGRPNPDPGLGALVGLLRPAASAASKGAGLLKNTKTAQTIIRGSGKFADGTRAVVGSGSKNAFQFGG